MDADSQRFDRYLSQHYAHLGDQARYRARRKRQLLHTYEHVLPKSRDAELLEVGPGYGQWLEALRVDRGYTHAMAVDVSAEVVDFCNRAMPGSTTLVTDTTGYLRHQAGRFDRVFAFHVLEHVPLPELPALVSAIRGALKPGGLCVVEVPNMANALTAGALRYGDLTHEGGFTELSLRQLLESAGFAGVHCFEERLVLGVPQDLLAMAFRAFVRAWLRLVYRGYQLPVPAVLSPALCATAVAPSSAREPAG